MNEKIINSVCFIRKYGWGNSEEQFASRLTCLQNHIQTYNEAGRKATYLFEYDALIDPNFCNAVRCGRKNGDEVGLWLEIVKEACDDINIPWRGRDGWSWDYHVCPGFIMAYDLATKKKLIDLLMERVKTEFGAYPKTVGSWLIDTESMAYLSEKYDVDAFIICREQWGMDGYTLWGGPYYGPYFPSKNNMQTPAQTKENQINTPVFRMFINDPIYCYYEYAKTKYNDIDYGLFTQEPAWMCGQNPDWVRWQYDNIFASGYGFSYIQLGQENSFGWKGVDAALHMQAQFIADNAACYGYVDMTVGEMGRLFKNTYTETPARLVGALQDWAKKGNQSVWYHNKHYRVNLFSDKNEVWFRDIHVFFDAYRDKYLDVPATTPNALYDNPPIVDGIRMSDDSMKAGFFFGRGELQSYRQNEDGAEVIVTAEGQNIKIELSQNEIVMTAKDNFTLRFVRKENDGFVTAEASDSITYRHGNVNYKLSVICGKYENGSFASHGGKLVFRI